MYKKSLFFWGAGIYFFFQKWEYKLNHISVSAQWWLLWPYQRSKCPYQRWSVGTFAGTNKFHIIAVQKSRNKFRWSWAIWICFFQNSKNSVATSILFFFDFAKILFKWSPSVGLPFLFCYSFTKKLHKISTSDLPCFFVHQNWNCKLVCLCTCVTIQTAIYMA